MEKFLNVRSIEEIPLPYREVFSEYVHFNPVQSEVLDDVFDSDDSVVISSPTGSGKTTIFELAIVRLLMQYGSSNMEFKIIYISPMKSLCQERLIDWNKKFSHFGLNSICITGDSENAEFQNLIYHNLIISTPEKWDSLTRRWKEHGELVKVIKLFMIDEVHLLNEEDRGSTLEVIVSRMKTVQNSLSLNHVTDCNIRFIAVSATIGNIEDIAEWIGSPRHYRFPEEMRPVQLKKLVIGFSYKQTSSSAFKFDLSLNYKLQSLLMTHSEGKPTLIFCSTRKSVEMTAKHLDQTLKIKLEPHKLQNLQKFATNIPDVRIQDMLRHGIGVHHAGMDVETRHIIEELFRNGDLPILIATSTLAMGVNLPAHLVIIKSTKYYVNGTIQDYSATAIHQMIGRAGRPQFDTTATALILTTNEDKNKIEKMLSTTEPIESNLHRHLTEHLNAEVVLGTITGLDVALQWLASTFLYIRARINPRHYGLPQTYKKEQLDKKLLEMFQIDLNKLVRAGMITMDENINVSPTITGQLMANYYVDFETMKMFTQITGTEIFIQILAIISKCQEFSETRLRVSDKKTLNLLNKNPKKQTIRFPLNGKIKTWDMKVNCIIQAVLGNLEITDTSIQTESFTIIRNAKRIMKCLIHYLSMKKQNSFTALLNATILGKCLNAKLWEDSPYVSKQLTGIGSIFATQLANAGKDTFDNILKANPRDIETIVKRKPPFGDSLIEEVKHLPKFSMRMDKISEGCKLTITLENVDLLLRKSTMKETSLMTLLVGNDRNETIFHENYHIYPTEETFDDYIKTNVDNAINRNESLNYIENDLISDESESINKENKPSDYDYKDKNPKLTIEDLFDLPDEGFKEKNKIDNGNSFYDLAKDADDNNIYTGVCYGSKNDDVQADLDEICSRDNLKPNDIDSSEGLTKLNETFRSRNDDVQADLDEICQQEEKQKELSKIADEEDLMNFFNTSSLLSMFEDIDTKPASSIVETNEEIDIIKNTTEKQVASTESENKKSFERKYSFNNSLTEKSPLLYALSQKYLTDDISVKNTSFKPRTATGGRNITLKNILNQRGKKRKKLLDIHPAEDLEDQLIKREEPNRKQFIGMFKKPLKKKMSHTCNDNNNLPDSTMGNHPYKMEDRHSNDNSDTQKKNISWRSPLVFSPGIKFSPNTSETADSEIQSDSHNVSLDTSSSVSSKHLTTHAHKTPRRFKNSLTQAQQTNANRLPLSDKDYNNYQNVKKTRELDNIEKFSDIFSSQILGGLKTKERNSNRILTKRSAASACDYYLSETSKSIKKETETPKKEETRSMEETDENEINLNALEEENFFDYPEDEIIAQNRCQSPTYVPRTASSEEYVRKNYPVYPGCELVSNNRYLQPPPPTVDCRSYETWPNPTFSSVPKTMPNAMHFSNYVNPIRPDLRPCYPPMPNYGYVPQQYEMRPFVGQYGDVGATYGGAYQSDINPQVTASRGPFSPKNAYDGMLIPNTIPSATTARRFYRTTDDLNNSYLVPDPPFPVRYNQNIPTPRFFPIGNHDVPYGLIPEYQQSQDADKDFVMNHYWESLNRE
ncbi:probable ATP-dependent DNA helicase HFM1 [Diorhabda sublineata]|uniref:probable ATP-dependent DNA helicase HFM1 n=1 Tax=Diorhabda sublineata TaxID=1163346 RepID=UPI0024E05BB6|nr:probable ATP-dependent DNA helicase HFM1 [Diorhabda sublineata]